MGGEARSRAAICFLVGLGDRPDLSEGLLGVSFGRCENTDGRDPLIELRELSMRSESLDWRLAVLMQEMWCRNGHRVPMQGLPIVGFALLGDDDLSPTSHSSRTQVDLDASDIEVRTEVG